KTHNADNSKPLFTDAGTSINVTGGGLLQPDFLFLGANSGTNTVTVDGGGSALNANGVFTNFVNIVGGGNGAATVTFSTSATGSFTSPLLVDDQGVSGTQGTVNVQSNADLTL